MSTLAVLLAFVAVSQPIANVLHHVLVRHAVCAVHGELMHPGDDHSIARDDQDDDHGRAALHRDDAPADSHEHDDCTTPVISGDRALEASRGDAVRVLCANRSGVLEPSRADVSAARVRLYLIAPKNSPPVMRA